MNLRTWVSAAACAALLAGCSGSSGATDGGSTDAGPGDAGPPLSVTDAGAAAVQAHGCANCHTADFSGNPAGITENGVSGFPANLTPDPDTGLGNWTDSEIRRAITGGVNKQCQTLCVMPLFGSMQDPELGNIVSFLRGLPAVNKQISATTCPNESTDAVCVADGGI